MIQKEHNGAMVVGSTVVEVDRFIANDDKIRAGLCPNSCGKLSARDYGQCCERCGFMCNTPRDVL